jgi:hypothetical protein
MRHFTAHKFKVTFDVKAKNFFKKELERAAPSIHAFGDNTRIIRAEFGEKVFADTDGADVHLYFLMKVHWIKMKTGDVHHIVSDVSIFNDKAELMQYRAELERMNNKK